MTERTSREEVEDILHIYEPMDFQKIAKLARDYITLLDEHERLRAAQTTTLVACSRCGHGQRARHMVAVGDERLCVECAGAEMGRLRKALDTVIAEAGAIWDDDNPVHPDHGTGLDMMLFAARSALHNAADAPRETEVNP